MRMQAATTGRGAKAPYFTTEVTVDVDIDPDDLYDAGWHREEDCGQIRSQDKGGVVIPIPPPVTLAEAVQSLHRQAHPSQLHHVGMCNEEPCRSLLLSQVRGVAS